MELNIKKYGFVKTEKDFWIGWHDYLLKGINPKYGYYLYATLHYPRNAYLKSNDISFRMCKIILHRYYDYEYFENQFKEGESQIVYRGLIENDEDLEFLLVKLGIVAK